MSDGHVTVAQCVEGLPVGCFVWELLLCAFLAAFLLGSINEPTPFALGLVSTEWRLTEQNVQEMASAVAVGNFLSALVSGWLADRYGRATIMRGSILAAVSCGVVVQSARTLSQALFARFLLGFASGGLLAVLMPLVAELLPSKRRGFYLTIWCSGKPAGALFSVVVSCIFTRIDWTSFVTLLMVPAVVLYVLCRLDMLPESPRHLYVIGRRDEGYNTLLDMYDKEMLPLPWAPDSIAVTTAPPRSSSDSSGSKSSLKSFAASDTAVTVLLGLAVFFVGAASECMKTWMPMVLAEQESENVNKEQLALISFPFMQVQQPSFASSAKVGGLSLSQVPLEMATPDHRIIMVITQGYMIEIIGIIVCAFVATCTSRKQMVQYSLFAAAVFSFCALAVEQRSLLLLGPLLGAQLVAQSAALNFLLVYACERFPTSSRASAVGLVMSIGQLGRSTLPAVGALLLKHTSPFAAVLFLNSLYIAAWLLSLQLPLPGHRERPLHDVEETRGVKDPLSRARKQHMMTYQTV